MVIARAAVAPEEADLLCAAANCPPPFPLRVPDHGRTVNERRSVLRAAGERLAARGLADERGPLDVAEAFAHLLQDSTLALDVQLSVGTDVFAVVLLARRDVAVLTTQRLTGGDPTLRMAELSLDDAVGELLAGIPAHPAALTAPFSLPSGAIGRLYRELRSRGDIGPAEWEELLAAHGVTDRLARRLVTHLQPVLGNGNAGLATRGGYAGAWRRTGPELRWLDTERGRFQLVPADDGEWLSVNPMHPPDLAAALRGLVGALRR
ncbi:ESX secretion-associated protein EspG [Actinophytocola xanthii]|uniref:ESX secretion-associated protein EspG n=1 Tax=Actinophytocola xanthii TaxID=1912961 RepID=A0A1Q8CMP3_9PSEU|nr:ESX secretion-associated protein EspG [Actinophytocola xanthii]OLF15619.1 hypothetical protein BU204_21130 [Actinophytocola xanthii]